MKTTIRIPHTEGAAMYDSYVQADHVATLRTTRNMNASIYDCKNKKILVQDANGTIAGNKEWGMYITDEWAQYLIGVSNEGKEVDSLVKQISI